MDDRIEIAKLMIAAFTESDKAGIPIDWDEAFNVANISFVFEKPVRGIIWKRAERRANKPLMGQAIPLGEWRGLFPRFMPSSLEARQY